MADGRCWSKDLVTKCIGIYKENPCLWKVLVMLLVTVLVVNAEDAADNNLALGLPPIQIDPKLRRALLQALTQLEQESQEQAAFQQESFATEPPFMQDIVPIDSHTQDFSSEDYESFSEEGKEQQNIDFPKSDFEIIPDPEKIAPVNNEHDKKSIVQNLEDTKINFENKIESVKTVKDDVISDEETSVLSQEESRNLPSSINIQSNVIPTEKPKESNSEVIKSISVPVTTLKKADREVPQIVQSESATSTVVNNKNENGKNNASDKEVSIFQAPLVPAFTLHHDEQGLPRSVVPLFRQQPTAAAPTVKSQFVPISREEELEHRTIQLQQQLLQLQQQQNQQQYLLKQQQLFKETQERLKYQKAYQEEQQRSRQQQLYVEQQQRQLQQQRLKILQEEKIRQLKLQQQQLIFNPDQQQGRLRSQRQEQGTGIVDFQKSVDIPFRPHQQRNNIQSVPHIFRNQNQQSFNNFNNNFQQSFQPNLLPRPQPQYQQYRTIFEQEPSVSASLFNTVNTFQKPPTVDSQLKSLLYQSGVAQDLNSNIRNGASPHEDLNIVSKVLLLNHESRGDETSTRSGRTTLEGHHIRNIGHFSQQFVLPHQ